MPVSIVCPCGQRFRVEGQFAGETGICPNCGKEIELTGEKVAPFDVFISYSSKDKATADAAVAVLEQKGLRCWIAPRNIMPSKEWSESIIDGLESSRLMVLIFSDHSNRSQQVVREVERAVAKGIPIIPFRIENLMPSKAMEYFISTYHWLDAFHPPLEKHLQKLAETAWTLLEGAPASSREEPADVVAKLKAASVALLARDYRLRVLIGLAAAVLIVTLLAVWSIWSARPATASSELIDLKAKVEVVANKLRALEGGQGLEKPLADFQQKLNAAAALFADKQFQGASAAYEQAYQQGEALQALAAARRLAAEEKTAAATARSEAEQVGAKQYAPDPWRQGLDLEAKAAQAFEAGDFSTAQEQWTAAKTVFVAASAAAKVNAQPRMKALALWAGLATEIHSVYEQRRAFLASSGDPAASSGPSRGPREFLVSSRDWPPYRDFVAHAVQALAQECQPGLQFDKDLVDRYFQARDAAQRGAISTEILQQTATAHGEPADRAYRLGVNLALLKTFCAMGVDAPKIPRRLPAAHPEFINTTEKTLERAYQAGCSQETINAIKNVRRAYDSIYDGFSYDSWFVETTFQQMNDEFVKHFDENFGDVEKTAAYFRAAQPAQAPAPAALDSAIQEAVAALKEQRALIAFDVDRADRPPKSLGFVEAPGHVSAFPRPPGGSFDSDEAVENIAKLKTLQGLNLEGLKITDDHLFRLRELSSLRRLSLSWADVSDEGLEHLRPLTQLTFLRLNHTNIGDAGAAHLAALSNLEELSLKRTQVTDASVAHLKNLARLKRLDVSNTGVTAAGGNALQAALPACEITGILDSPEPASRSATEENPQPPSLPQ